MPPPIRLLRAADRPTSSSEGVVSRHGLSFGAHYDPDRTSFGALAAHNDDVLAPGAAYGAHDHRDVEILAWVVEGVLRHHGPDGAALDVPAGTLQQLVAGTGWRHDEACAGAAPVHVVQMWFAPRPDDPPPGPPSLRHVVVGDREPVDLHRPDASLTVARLGPGELWAPTPVWWRHVHVTRGAVGTMSAVGTEGAEGEHAGEGDTLEVTGDAVVTLVAGPDGAEVLVVSTDPGHT